MGVQEKKEPDFKNGICKDGVHIIYPDICVDKFIAEELRVRVIEVVKERNLFEELNLQNSVEEIIDAASSRNHWLMYGCKKPGQKYPYKLTHIYDIDLEEKKLDDLDINRSKLINIFSIRRFKNKDLVNIKNNDFKNIIEIRKKEQLEIETGQDN